MSKTYPILFFLAWLIVGCQSATSRWAQIEREGVLRVGLDPTYPPFENLVNGELQGLDIDLIQQIGNSLGLEVHFDIIGYDGLYDALLTGRVDVLASALIIDETRTKEFAYSEPYFNAGEVLVVSVGSSIRDQADLANGVVAVELGAAGHVVATEWQNSAETLQILPLDTADAALQAVANQDVDAAIIDAVSAQIGIAASPTLQIANSAVTVDPFALVVRSADGQLLRNLDRALAQMLETGALDQLITKWMR